MSDELTTHASLLARLRDAEDGQAWQHFAQLYAPLVYQYYRNHHFQDADAADLTQEVLQDVSKTIGRLDYDPQRGSFRGWLFTLAHHRMYDFLNHKHRQEQGTGDSAVQGLLKNVPAPDEDLWNREYEKQLFFWALEQAQNEFSATTWQAFRKTAIEGHPVRGIAEQLGLSVGAVYIARTRVQARLKEKIMRARGD